MNRPRVCEPIPSLEITHYATQRRRRHHWWRLQRGWAGHYAVTPDENPILGQHPAYPHVFMATGFSGHGVMLAPATGKAISELIQVGRSETLDIRPYRLEWFASGDLIPDPQI